METLRVLVLTGRPWARAVAAPTTGGFDYPATLQGTTAHFAVYFDPALGDAGGTIADGVLASCENDYQALSGFFGGVTPPGLPFNIIIAAGIPGAYHYGCGAVDLYCDAQTAPLNVDFTRFLLVAEAVEVFEDAQGQGWDCGASNGEGLSRALAAALYPAQLDGFATAPAWLDSGDRPDFITTNDPTDTNPVSTGCAVLFLNYLHSQLGFDWPQIVQAGGPTLAQTYTNLTGRTDALVAFRALLEAAFPAGAPSGLTTDNPFPLPANDTSGGQTAFDAGN